MPIAMAAGAGWTIPLTPSARPADERISSYGLVPLGLRRT